MFLGAPYDVSGLSQHRFKKWSSVPLGPRPTLETTPTKPRLHHKEQKLLYKKYFPSLNIIREDNELSTS